MPSFKQGSEHLFNGGFAVGAPAGRTTALCLIAVTPRASGLCRRRAACQMISQLRLWTAAKAESMQVCTDVEDIFQLVQAAYKVEIGQDGCKNVQTDPV